jgi:peptide/nickel transport system substrate-binding protein
MTRFAAAALAVLLLGAIAPSAHAGSDTFIFYEDEMGLSANPVHERSMSDVRLNELIHVALYAPNYADQPQPVLAESAELDDSGRVLTIKLKEMKWSDGKPVSAEDVVFTLQTYKNPASRSLDRNRWDFIMKAEAPDAKTVVLTFARTYREPPASQLYLKIIPKHFFKSTEVAYNHSYRTKPVTAGPFSVAEKDHKNWILKRNDAGSRQAKLKEVRCQEVPEKRTQAELMSYEYGHAMIEVEPQQRAELDADQCCTLKPYPSKSWWYTGFNQKNPHLADAKVRVAMSLAIDRQQALDLIGEGELISGPFTLSSRYYNHDVTVPTQDISKATALMEEAGYTKTGADWTKKGNTVDLRFFYDEALGEQGQTVATNIVGQLKKFGINISNPAAIGGESWEERIMQKNDYDLVMGVWSFDVNEDIGQLFATGGVRNFVGFSDDRTNQLLTGAYESQDPSEQQAYMKEIHRRLADTAPYVFLWSLRNFSAISWDIQGAHLQAFYYFTQFPDWSLKED